MRKKVMMKQERKSFVNMGFQIVWECVIILCKLVDYVNLVL